LTFSKKKKPQQLTSALHPVKTALGSVDAVAVYVYTGCANKKQSPRKNSISPEL